MIAAGNPIAIRRAIGPDNGLNFLAQGQRDPLIGVKHKNPGHASLGHGLIFGFPEPLPGHGKDPIGKFSSQFDGAVGAAGIKHDNFVRPPGRFQTRDDIGFFI